jgi:hypothetical protein
MANEAEAEWDEFKRHKFKGVRIEDRKESIHFSQRENIYDQRATAPLIIARALGGAAWFIPTIIIAVKSGWFPAGIYFCLASAPVLLFMLLAYVVFRDRRSINIYPGSITIAVGRRSVQIPNDDIQNIDVRINPNSTYGVYVWNKKIPILTVTQELEHQAISLREGILLAINVVNHVEVVTGEQLRQESAARGRKFDE